MRKFSILLVGLFLVTLMMPVPRTQAAEQVDVVVIGAGGAGLAAAIEAVDAGAKVVVLEKMPMIGGNTMYATGGLNAAGTEYQKKKGIQDSPELFFKDTMKGGHHKNDPELVRVLTTQAKDAVDWLVGLGADLTNVGRLGGHSVNRTHRPTGGAAVGATVVKTLKQAARERKVDIRTRQQVTAFLKNSDGSVGGVRLINKDKQEVQILAKAVVVAAGGFGASQDKIVRYQAGLKGFGTTNHQGATGDAIDMGQAFGVAFVDLDQIQTHPTVVPRKGIMITEAVRGNGAILVNRDGQRFVNELTTRDVVSAAILAQQGKTAFLIFDQGVRNSLKAIEKYIRLKLVSEADTIESLAAGIGIKAAALAKTVAAYNQAASAGKDEAFKRTNMARKLEAAKFYAVEVGPAVHHTMGGIKINTRCEVMDKAGKPVSGLFAAGEVTGGVHGANRLGGNAQADIIVFGRIAGRNAAGYASGK